MTKKSEDITALSYSEMNDALLACNSQEQLHHWLSDTVATGVLYRSLRVHGRLNAVRRAQEVEVIKKTCMAAQKVRV